MNPYQHHTDPELVALLIDGNERAFAVIYERYAFDLYRYARKNIQNSEDCREIVQDIFESLWKRHAELQHVTVLDAYLYRSIKYKIIHYAKHQAVKRKYAEHYKVFEVAYDSIRQEEPIAVNLQEMIDNSLAELPERCQVAVRLRLKENLSNGDIAQRLNINKHTVENYMVTAMNHFRAAYKKLYKMG